MGRRGSEEVTGMLFDLPAKRQMMPTEPILRTADIWAEANCRFSLRRAWGPGPAILWCGANPSTADTEKDDPTMLREIGFSFRWGFGSLVKVNIEPLISSDPSKLDEWCRDHAASSALRSENVDRVAMLLQTVDVRVAAWGNLIKPEVVDDFLQCVHFMLDGSIDVRKWSCLGTTKSGAPKHTLARGLHRIPDDAVLQDWRHPHSFGPY